jgi:hypothetical protein
MIKSLVIFKVLTGLANALDKRNLKGITPNDLRAIAKTTLKNNGKLGTKINNQLC